MHAMPDISPPPTEAVAPPELRLLGSPRLQRAGQPVALPLRKAWALLAHAAVEGGATRSRLAGLLWSDNDEAAARRNLRRELHRLREAGLGELLRIDGVFVALGPCRCDLHDFDAALREGRVDEALALYGGRLLDGLDSGSALFDDWLHGARARLHARWQLAARQRVQALQDGGEPRAALALQLRVLEEDALQEADFRVAMQLHAQLGEREAALALYERCRAMLGRELGLPPMAQTVALAEQIRRQPAHTGPADTPASSGPAPADPAAQPPAPLAGRQQELARLHEALRQRPATLLLQGPAGVGKTRLAAALAEAQPSSLRFEARAHDAQQPYAAWRRWLLDLGATAQTLPAALQRPLSLLLDGLVDGPPPQALPAAVLQQALASAWLALVPPGLALACFDDLQALADEDFAALMALQAHRHRPALLLLARDDEGPAERRAALQALALRGAALALRLGPLDAAATAELLAALAGDAASPPLAARLQRATGGHPLFVVQTLRHLAETGWPVAAGPAASAAAADAALPLPRSVHDAVAARLQRLPDPQRRLVEAAACADEPLPLELLAPAGALAEDEAVDAFERLLAAGLMARDADGAARCAHELVRDAVAAGLTPERRRLLLRRLARSLPPGALAPARLAALWEQGGQPLHAAPLWAQAAAQAEDMGAPQAALALAERALAANANPRTALELQLQRARLLRRLSRAEAAGQAAAAADATARRLGDLVSLARAQLARAELQSTSDREAAQALVDALLARPRLPPLLRSQALHLSAQFARMRGDLAACAASGAAALAALPPGNWRSRGDIGVLLGFGLMFSGRGREAQRAFEAAARAAGEAGADVVRVRALCGAAAACADRGEMAASRALCEQALQVTRAVGLVSEQRTAMLNLLRALLALGELARAQEIVDAGIALSPQYRDLSEEQAFAEARFAVALAAGELAQALAAMPALLAVSRRCQEAYRAVSGLMAPLDLLLQWPPWHGQAAALLDEAEASLGAGQLQDLRCALHCRRAALLLAAGQTAAARALLDAVLADPALREQDRAHALRQRAECRLAGGDAAGAAQDLQRDFGALNPEAATLAWAARLRVAAAGEAPALPATAAAAAAWLLGGRAPPLESLALADALQAVAGTLPPARRRAVAAAARRLRARLHPQLAGSPQPQAGSGG